MIRVLIDICKMSIMQREIDSPQNLNDEKSMAWWGVGGGGSIMHCFLNSIFLKSPDKEYRMQEKNKSKLSTKACLKYDNEY